MKYLLQVVTMKLIEFSIFRNIVYTIYKHEGEIFYFNEINRSIISVNAPWRKLRSRAF
jgi:hypothetical protein